MDFKLEVIGYNIESCRIAQSAGAHRIELCDNPGDGGTTASYGFIKAARELLTIPLYPIIRPRGGDFCYTDAEFDIMKSDVHLCKQLGCDGVVIGLLQPDGSVDIARCSQLLEHAYPMEATFHRAFDRANDPLQALEDIIALGFERILTSGQRPTAPEGAELIRTLVEKANNRIIIMPGSGVRSNNIISLAQKTGAIEFHSSAGTQEKSRMEFQNTRMNEQLDTRLTAGEEIEKMIDLLNKA